MVDIIDRIPQNEEGTIFTTRVDPEKLNACIDDILRRLERLEEYYENMAEIEFYK